MHADFIDKRLNSDIILMVVLRVVVLFAYATYNIVTAALTPALSSRFCDCERQHVQSFYIGCNVTLICFSVFHNVFF